MFWKKWKKKNGLGRLPIAMLVQYLGMILLVIRKDKLTGQNLFTIPTGTPDEEDVDRSTGVYSKTTLVREACEELRLQPDDIKNIRPIDVIVVDGRLFLLVSCMLTKRGYESADYEEDESRGQIWARPPNSEIGLERLTLLSELARISLALINKSKKGVKNASKGYINGRILSSVA